MKTIYRLKKHKSGLVAQQQEALVRFRGSGANLNLALGFDASVFKCIQFSKGKAFNLEQASDTKWLWRVSKGASDKVATKVAPKGEADSPAELLESSYAKDPDADIWFCRTDKELQTILKAKADYLSPTKANVEETPEAEETLESEENSDLYAKIPEEAAHN